MYLQQNPIFLRNNLPGEPVKMVPAFVYNKDGKIIWGYSVRKGACIGKEKRKGPNFPPVIFLILPWLASSHIIPDNLSIRD